ncbi:MAG: ABC transporter permease [Pseudomonadota bacterium]|nr:ABC transporter permease [Pseudomonadota bacterium]
MDNHRYITRPMVGKWNARGLWALYYREVNRFLKIWIQTLIAPVISALIFLLIFNLAFDGEGRSIPNIPFADFLVPGLTLMALMTSCFANSSFTLTFEKIVQSIFDTLLPPMSPAELTTGYLFASATRGLLVALIVGFSISIFVPFKVTSWPFVIFHAIGGALLMSSLGLITAIWAEKVDHVASINNFIILPVTFLSGTFYSIKNLPELFQTVILLNPVFYIVDGFRYGFFGYADGSLQTGIVLVIVINVTLWIFCIYLFKTGYKLRS